MFPDPQYYKPTSQRPAISVTAAATSRRYEKSKPSAAIDGAFPSISFRALIFVQLQNHHFEEEDLWCWEDNEDGGDDRPMLGSYVL
ncbi:hypothetical protein C1H46_031144 [Malus baccata]|uniref:Uncharacterized protein n=1 Tax=Malus baccata TaxID=106549 RepID=A0A540L9Y0_MALBA|nr:hypothetical protein C1H46_031144 [Malus baccata]